MVAQLNSNALPEAYEDHDNFEKITHRRDAAMPTRSGASAKRAMKRTSASRRASRLVSRTSGGMHQRRLRRFK